MRQRRLYVRTFQTDTATTGFQATALIFPTEGCWEVTGEVADTRVKFVTRVVRVK